MAHRVEHGHKEEKQDELEQKEWEQLREQVRDDDEELRQIWDYAKG